MRKRICTWLTAIVLGFIAAEFMLMPKNTDTLLSSVVLYFSGADFFGPLGHNMNDACRFIILFLPYLLFQALMGVSFYSHYCKAGVYVFSRIENREQWFIKEAQKLAIDSLVYVIMLVLSGSAVIFFVRGLIIDVTGLLLMIFHVVIYTLWTFCFTLIVNLAAVCWGSAVGFAVTAGVQFIMIVLFTLTDLFKESILFQNISIRLNPASMLVLSWQGSFFSPLQHLPVSETPLMHYESSVVLLLLSCMMVIAIGKRLILNKDIVASDPEAEGV